MPPNTEKWAAETQKSTANIGNGTAEVRYSTAVIAETATAHRHEAEPRCNELDILIKQEQLAEARARSALAIHNLEEAMWSGQAAAAVAPGGGGFRRKKPIKHATFPVPKSSLLANLPSRPIGGKV